MSRSSAGRASGCPAHSLICSYTCGMPQPPAASAAAIGTGRGVRRFLASAARRPSGRTRLSSCPPWTDAVLEPVPGISATSRTLTLILDDLFEVPGTQVGVGLDALVGLIPGIGDAGTTVVASAVMADAVRNRVPIPVLARMGLNLGIDVLLGLVPGVGDLLDVAHRANRKNLRLLGRPSTTGSAPHSARSSTWSVQSA